MDYLSVCSGIEAATVAWQPLGWSAYGFSEIEKFPNAVLQHHYPETPNYGDMNDFRQWPKASIDVLVGGTPCQSFSVAGLGKGMADPRGRLALVYLAIADRYRPDWLVWENVPGVLSKNEGRDFGSIVGGMVKLGYGIAYRVLDAQYVGVPQRRRRVFVVGYLGDWRRAAEILFEPQSLRRNPPPCRETRQRIAGTIKSGARNSGTDNSAESADRLIHCPDVSPAMKARDYKGPSSDGDGDGLPLLAHSLRGEGFDASEDGTGRGTPLVAAPLSAGSNPNSNAAGRRREDDENIVAIQERAVSENPDTGPDGAGFRTDNQAYTLEARSVPQAVAFAQNQRDEVRLMDKAGALAAEPGAKQQTYVFRDVAASIGANYGKQPDNSNTSRGPNLAVHQMAVRRLTPLECERLQGFPDGYTDIPGASDSGRYKALGNSMAVPVMRWIGKRITAVCQGHENE